MVRSYRADPVFHTVHREDTETLAVRIERGHSWGPGLQLETGGLGE